MKSYKLVLLCLIIIAPLSLMAQDIRGKWMQVKIPHYISYPQINIIEITGDSIFSYNFDRLYDKGKVEITHDQLILRDTISIEFEFLGNNIFVQNTPNQIEDDNTEFKFVRLLPTEDLNNMAKSLDSTIYRIPFPNEKLTFKLGEKMNQGHAYIINDPPIAFDHSSIEMFGETYFLCFYTLGRLSYVFPIKEIYSDSLVLYGIPGAENEVVARRVQ